MNASRGPAASSPATCMARSARLASSTHSAMSPIRSASSAPIEPARQRQCAGARLADPPHQEMGRAHVGHEAELRREDEGQAGRARGDGDVAHQRERGAGAGRHPVLRDHQRHRQIAPHERHRVVVLAQARGHELAHGLPGRRKALRIREVGAGAEAAPGPGQQHRPQAAIALDRLGAGLEVLQQPEGQAVQLLGTIERDDEDARPCARRSGSGTPSVGPRCRWNRRMIARSNAGGLRSVIVKFSTRFGMLTMHGDAATRAPARHGPHGHGARRNPRRRPAGGARAARACDRGRGRFESRRPRRRPPVTTTRTSGSASP